MNSSPRAVGAHPTDQRRKRRGALLALFALFAAILTVSGPAQTAQATPICTPGIFYANTGGAVEQIDLYTTTGELRSSVPTVRSYTDIAFSADGLTLYGILPGLPSVLYTIDLATGAETAAIPMPGLPTADYYVNALSALADGSLLIGAARIGGVTAQQIYRIDPATGAATLYPASFPAGFGSSGDFLSLADGDILAVGDGPTSDALFRIAPDFSLTQVGTIPEVFGAAQSGGRIYLAGSGGDIYEIATVPTAASTEPAAITTIVSTGQPFYGATSQQDSGLCSELTIAKSADPASGTAVALGQTVTYTVTLSNANGTAPAEVDHTDDLAGVLDDATLTSEPIVSAGTDLTIDPISGGGFRVSGIIPVGEQSTITYAVRIDDPATGDHQLTNHVVPTGTTPPTTCEPASPACTTHPISDLALVKSVAPDGGETIGVGDQVTYSFLVTNTGRTTLTDVAIDEGAFTGSGELGAITPSAVASLAPGASTTFTATYTMTQADIDRGTTVNTATSTGVPPTGPPLVSPPSTVEIPSVPAPGLTLVKSADRPSIATVGEELTYSFLVTNTGSTTLSDVVVEEGAFTGSGELGPITPASVESLAPGASATFTATYVVTRADLDEDRLVNTATATGVPPYGPPVESPPSTVRVPSLTPPAAPVPSGLATTGSEPMWSALLAAALLIVIGGALSVRSGSRLSLR